MSDILQIGGLSFDVNALAQCLSAPEEWFAKFGKVISTVDGNIIYKDNGAKVLSVAHLDTVQVNQFHGVFSTTVGRVIANKVIRKDFVPPDRQMKLRRTPKLITKESFPLFSKKKRTVCIEGQGLDDRLGAFVILYMLKQVGVETDILLTTGEESGMSTARYLAEKIPSVKNKYNWMFEFDRAGFDVVLYQYETDRLKQLLSAANFSVGIGSYSDICDLWELGVAGMNIGTGVYRSHAVNSFAILPITAKNILRFKSFYDQNKDLKIKSAAKSSRRTYVTNSYGKPWHSRTNQTEPYYATFSCSCGEEHKWIIAGRDVACKCGIDYLRGENTGHIYTVIERGENYVAEKIYLFKCVTIKNKTVSSLHGKSSTAKCDICQKYSSVSTMEMTDGGKVCSSCVTELFSVCPLCESVFFACGIQFIYCDQCENYIFNGEEELIWQQV